MEEMRVYIANLCKYNEGELVGNWFTPSVDYDEMAERIGLNVRYEEYAIHDYELLFEIDKYTPFEKVNRLCTMVEELEYPLNEVIDDLLCQFCSIEELYDHKDDIIKYPGCDNMVDVAYHPIDECEALGKIPDQLEHYINNYEPFALNLDLEGCFAETRYGV